jgi:hypothetical protein
MSAPNPAEFPELYESLLLGGVWSPGVVTLTGHDRTKAWDNQAAKGASGATSKLNGDPIGQFQASFYLVKDGSDDPEQDDFTRWETFQRLVESTTNGPKPVALPIYHPELLANGFTEVVNAGVGGKLWDDRGGCTVIVKFQEYRPEKPKKVASATAKSSVRQGTTTVERPDPNAAAKRELAALVDEAKRP